ncbi:MAG: SufD family Fe-S cluster assembly protein [Gammaproteobacteria bacterium]|nr:SufD family Fe-S cluster assembly protein [Gammaproteobacteria bacterium]
MSALPATMPTPRDEHWKYANLRGLARARFEPSVSPPAETVARITAALPKPLEGFERIVLIDGFVSSVSSTPSAFTTTSPISIAKLNADRYFLELNRRLRSDTLRLAVARHQKRSVEVVVVSLGTSHPAIEIALAEGAELSLIERHLPLSADATVINLVIFAVVGVHAQFELSRIVQASPKAQHVETIELRLCEGSASKFFQLTTGAALSRTTAFAAHDGRDSSLEWHAAALGEGTQSHDAFVHVAHSAPSAKTLQQFRGIAADRSRVSFTGHMRVDTNAPYAQCDQSLKCLLTGSEAEADVRPQLEILTDAVRASHGATVGKLDPDMLFYLLSRGIPEESASSLLKWAFVSDVLRRLSNPAIRAEIEYSLERVLPGAVAARSGT